MWTEIATAGGLLGMVGMIVKFQHNQIRDIRKQHKQNLFKPDGRTVYIPRPECEEKSDRICFKKV